MTDRAKIQITLPSEMAKRIEADIKDTYTNKSLWFEKVVNFYFNNHKKSVNKVKKVIELEI